jgi:hypothetical protein
MNDLAAVRANMRQMAAWLVGQGRGGEYVQVMSAELLAVLEAFDTQAARLVAVERTACQVQRVTNENRHYRIVQQYLVAVLEAAEAHLAVTFGGQEPFGRDAMQTRRALNVACEQARERLTRLGMAADAAGEGRADG